MAAPLSIETESPEGTERAGYDLGKTLKPDDLVALYGELGAGKTCFVRGIARALDLSVPVKSPSFSIINEYSGEPQMVHIDFYRLKSAKEINDLGWTEYLNSGAIVVIEWAERVKNMLPPGRIDVYFQILNDSDRRLEIVAVDGSGN